MMKVEQVKTPDDIERYIEGRLNDFEEAISTKDETVVFLAELVVHVYKEAKKEQCNISNVVRQGEQPHSCRYVKRIGESCTLNNNCKYPKCAS